MRRSTTSLMLVAFLAILGLVGVAGCGGGKSTPKLSPSSDVPLGLPQEGQGGRLGALSYTVPCYVAQGGRTIVAASGCTIQVQDGGTLDLDDGSTLSGAISNDMDGAALLFSPDGNTLVQATADNHLIAALGGTPTAASFTINDSQGTPVAKFRGGAGGIDIMGSLLAASGQTLRGHLVVGTSTPAVVVASTPLAPGGAAQPISIATAGTVPLTIPSAGSRICVWNTGSEVITIQDTGNQVLTADAVLGQYDVLCGFSDGTRFIESSRANN